MLTDIRHVFAALGKTLRQQKSTCLYDEDWSEIRQSIVHRIKTLSIFPTKNRDFTSIEDSSPVLIDGDNLEFVFGEVDAIKKRAVDVTVETLENADSDLRFFVAEVCEFPLLSLHVVESVKEAKNFSIDKRMKKFLRRLFLLLQVYPDAIDNEDLTIMF